jgi:hypothetical protein
MANARVPPTPQSPPGPSPPRANPNPSQNAIRHRLFSKSIVLDDASAERFAIVLSLVEDERKPVTGIEQRFVETTALAHRRQVRLWTMEKVQIDRETRKQYLDRYGQEFSRDSEVDNSRVTFAAFRIPRDERRVPHSRSGRAA